MLSRLFGSLLGSCGLVVVGCLLSAAAPIDGTFNYQARLTSGGVPITGLVDARFSMWDAAAGGAQIGSSIEFLGESVADGLYNADLDFGVAALNGDMRWLQVEVRSPAGVGGYVVLGRREILGAPYAIQTRGLFVDDALNVGIGTTTPARALHVAGNGIRLSNGTRVLDIRADGGAVDIESTTHSLFIHSSGPGGKNHVILQPFGGEGNVGIGTELPKQKLHNTGDYYGRGHIYLYAFQGDGSDGDAYLQARDDSGTSSIGMQFRTQDAGQFVDAMYLADDGRVGIGTDTPSYPLHVVGNGELYVIFAHATATGGTGIGLYGRSDVEGGRGVLGIASATTGFNNYGVQGGCAAPVGAGVFGSASSTTGSAYGVEGKTTAPSGRGVYGYATDSSGGAIGVRGASAGIGGRGVMGSTSAITGLNHGVFGENNSPSGYGVYSNGRFGGTGAKYFIQPHPEDPGKQIRFVCLEGNESGTYFRGSSRLEDGRAYIDVPEEFRLVSETDGLTVQLTPRGPNAGLWIESSDLDRIVIVGNGNVEFDYFVNGVRRGFADLDLTQENHAYVPEVRGVPYGTQYRPDHRQILVKNGILNPDFTPNEQTAAQMGWELRDPTPEEVARHALAPLAQK